MTVQEGDSYDYELTVTVDDEAMHSTAKDTVKDGRLVRGERFEAVREGPGWMGPGGSRAVTVVDEVVSSAHEFRIS